MPAGSGAVYTEFLGLSHGPGSARTYRGTAGTSVTDRPRTHRALCHRLPTPPNHEEFVTRMKVRASVKRLCEHCKIIKRDAAVRVICEIPKHKQRQG